MAKQKEVRIKHIIYDTLDEAQDRANLHNESRSMNSRFSCPRRTPSGKYVLVVNDYDLTESEEAKSAIAITTVEEK